jgi:tetratricopeptide (TPR) repeat protein
LKALVTNSKRDRKAARRAETFLPIETGPVWWHYCLGAFAVLFCAFQVYAPALHGEFVFDDLHMPFLDPNAGGWPLKLWLSVRPFLMTTFWANFRLSGTNPYPYHVVNVFLHACAAMVLFFVVRRILELAEVGQDRRTLLAGFATAVFLLHPMQTEAVSYVTQRGEDLGALFYFAAFCAFLYRREHAVSWPTTAIVMALFGLAVTTKEHTVTLPALLLLTDYYWNRDSEGRRFTLAAARGNWRLYAITAAGGLAGALFVWRYISRDTTSIGFQLQDYTWSQYLFTQFRAFFAYIGLFLLPIWQSIDYDFAVSHNLLEHGAALWLAGILCLGALAVFYRRRFPLASYGFFVFILLLLPTSSVIPLKDALADRRLYLPMIGLLFIALEILRAWEPSSRVLIATCTAVCLLLAVAAYRRNEKWSTALLLWADAADKVPNKPRVQFGFGVSQFFAGHCHEAIPHYEKAIALAKPDFTYYMNLGMAYDCDQQPEKAIQALKHSVEINPTAKTWANIALVQAKMSNTPAAMEALEKAQGLDPNLALVYLYRGGIYHAMSRWQDAADQYGHALALEPLNEGARNGLQAVQAQLGTRH